MELSIFLMKCNIVHNNLSIKHNLFQLTSGLSDCCKTFDASSAFTNFTKAVPRECCVAGSLTIFANSRGPNCEKNVYNASSSTSKDRFLK